MKFLGMNFCKGLIVVCYLLFCSCHEASQQTKQVNTPYIKAYSKKQLDSINEIKISKKVDSLAKKHFQEVLKLLKENDISQDTNEVYRLFLTGERINFAYSAIRIEKIKDTVHLIAKIYWGPVPQPDGSVRWYGTIGKDSLGVINKTISQKDWLEYKNLLNGADFWLLASIDNERKGEFCTFYTLEGRGKRLWRNDPMEYHIVRRSCPFEGSFKSACDKLIKLSGVKLTY